MTEDDDDLLLAIVLWPTGTWVGVITFALFVGWLFYEGHLSF